MRNLLIGIKTRVCVTAVAASAAYFVSCAPVTENARHTTPEVHTARPIVLQESSVSGSVATQLQMGEQTYRSDANPFELNSALRTSVDDAMAAGTDTRARVERLFSSLHAGSQGRMPVLDMTGRPPRTAGEALSSGGDCTDLANVGVAGITEMNRRGANITGGALVVHFNSRPQDEHHMVPYVVLDGREVIFDLQTSRLGDIAPHSVILRMSFSEAASIYHGEAGDYFRSQGREPDAATAYEAAVQRFSGDIYVMHNLAAIYERASNWESMLRVMESAARIDPSYSRHAARARYMLEFGRGERAHREGRMGDCATHFRNARLVITSQHPFDSQRETQELTTLDNNIRVCGGSGAGQGTTITSPE